MITIYEDTLKTTDANNSTKNLAEERGSRDGNGVYNSISVLKELIRIESDYFGVETQPHLPVCHGLVVKLTFKFDLLSEHQICIWFLRLQYITEHLKMFNTDSLSIPKKVHCRLRSSYQLDQDDWIKMSHFAWTFVLANTQ